MPASSLMLIHRPEVDAIPFYITWFACQWPVQFCELTKGPSSPHSPLIHTQAPLSWKSFLGDAAQFRDVVLDGPFH